MSRVTEWDPSRLVCAQCVDHLRDACSFKKQVLEAEAVFNKYWSSKDPENTFCNNPETENIDQVPAATDSFADIAELLCENQSKIEIQISALNNNEQIPPRKRRKTQVKKKKTKINLDSEIDSDTPIKTLLNQGSGSKDPNDAINDSAPADLTDTVQSNDEGEAKKPQNVKQISEQQRLKGTCEAVLRGSTACPFRHHRSWFQCFFCTQDFIDIIQLREHTAAIHTDLDDELKKIKRYPKSLLMEITNLQCRHCGTNLADVESMRCHFKEAHDQVIYIECIADYKIETSPYTCHRCGRQFHVFRSLTVHLNEHNANCICDICGKSYLNYKRLKVHKRTHEIGEYPCEECGKVFKTKISIANHMECVHSKRVIKCQICSKPVKHYNDRVKHMSEAHGITYKFKCPMCPREYNVRHYLSAHVRQTHGQRSHKCSECDMAFMSNHALTKHKVSHSNVKQYECPLCSRSYMRNNTLREHIRINHGDSVLASP